MESIKYLLIFFTINLTAQSSIIVGDSVLTFGSYITDNINLSFPDNAFYPNYPKYGKGVCTWIGEEDMHLCKSCSTLKLVEYYNETQLKDPSEFSFYKKKMKLMKKHGHKLKKKQYIWI